MQFDVYGKGQTLPTFWTVCERCEQLYALHADERLIDLMQRPTENAADWPQDRVDEVLRKPLDASGVQTSVLDDSEKAHFPPSRRRARSSEQLDTSDRGTAGSPPVALIVRSKRVTRTRGAEAGVRKRTRDGRARDGTSAQDQDGTLVP